MIEELARELAGGPRTGPNLRLRQGAVVSVDSSTTVTVTLGADAAEIPGVHWLKGYVPVAGDVVWLAQNGSDLMVLGTLEDATGWTPYTGTIWLGATTNPTIGNGTVTGRYRRLDARTCEWQVEIVTGTTTTLGSGAYSVAVPLQAASGIRQMAFLWTFNGTAAGNKPGTGRISPSGTSAGLFYTSTGQWSPTIPDAWTVGTAIFLASGTYQNA